ncbi:hypothetical protein GC089_01975 [Cellulomonas sp. JZ18]|uniref:hypothetical protein n=1 Tax=Cellulomonas sp. JZ18 TaxID=2654191 RepID=UPI0012D409FF|nr:hypothetical protein [Cellulomonas sp. JZ18]QGQ18256.1 hypothetical protein GC089_01975 [Cellulomonas sp. JZ18]
MSTATAPRTVATGRRTSPLAHALRRQLGVALYLAAWYWAIALVVLLVATLIVWRVNGTVDVSIVAYARQSAIWFPFSQAILLVAALLRPHLAAGMTRRTFVRSSLVTAVSTGLGYTLVLSALLLVERALHSAVGWDAEILEQGFELTGRDFPSMVGELAPALVLANLCGLLVGVVYHRFGGWWGTVTLPLTVLPIVATLALAGEWFASLPALDGVLSGPADAPLLTGAVLVVVTAGAYVALARSTPVRTPR